MNWQLLIKMVSFSLHPALEWRVLLSGKSTEREPEREFALETNRGGSRGWFVDGARPEGRG